MGNANDDILEFNYYLYKLLLCTVKSTYVQDMNH